MQTIETPAPQKTERNGFDLDRMQETASTLQAQPDMAQFQFRATGGMLAKIFDVQNKRFTTVTCTQCKYTEIYRSTSSGLGNVFDFFTS